MKSITIHHPNIPLDTSSREKSFLDLFGVWSREEVEEFNRHVGDFEKIDQEDWA